VSGSISRKRPWLAALLGAVATGLGHLYLRRWRRAFGWLALLVGVSVVFVDPATIDALATGGPVDPLSVVPLAVVAGFSVADAYLLAHARNAVARTRAGPDGDRTHCPNCGKELDADLAFCHWCSAELEAADAGPAESDGQN
jgi:hypothetical protein